jgi:competence protein ComEA
VNLRDRLDSLSRGELGGLILVVVATLVGAGLWYTRSLPRPVQVTASRGSFSPAAIASGAGLASPEATQSPGAAPLVVDVAGMVRRPGVYRFAAGSRVIDAVHRAGGPRPGADLSLLNLAAPLTDGIQILVPKRGDVAAGGGAASSGGPAAPVNINTASETDLETLDGVGPVTAAAIIQYRTQHGPFRSIEDLVDVSGIGPATLEQLRPFITV